MGFLADSQKNGDPEGALQEAHSLVEWITTMTNPERIILFGSLARREFKFGSDIDLLILYLDVEAVRTARKTLAARRRESLFPHDFVFDTTENYLKMCQVGGLPFSVEREGVVLYDKKSTI